jgi:hypothetical protein
MLLKTPLHHQFLKKGLNSDKITPFLHKLLYKIYVTVCYTNGCLCSNVTADDGQGERPKHVEFLK